MPRLRQGERDRETGTLMSLTKTDSWSKTNERAPARKCAYQRDRYARTQRSGRLPSVNGVSVRASSSPSLQLIKGAISRKFERRRPVPVSRPSSHALLFTAPRRCGIHHRARARVERAHTQNVSLFFVVPFVIHGFFHAPGPTPSGTGNGSRSPISFRFGVIAANETSGRVGCTYTG